jgi:hypothetical protein
MGELDDRLPLNQRVKISDYQKYGCDLDIIDPLVEKLYSLYFESGNQFDV